MQEVSIIFQKEQEQNLGDSLVLFKTGDRKSGTSYQHDDRPDWKHGLYTSDSGGTGSQAVTAEEWLQLFEQIVEKSIYEVLILDLGDSVNGLFSILEKCDSVHTLSIEEPAAKAKLQQYGGESFADRT